MKFRQFSLLNKNTKENETHNDIAQMQYRCLMVFCMMEAFVIALGGSSFNFISYYVAENFLIIPCVGFLALYSIQSHSEKVNKRFLFCCASVVWFILLQLYHNLCGDETTYSFALYACGMLLAFPFAMVSDADFREKGFRVLTNAYLAGGLLICFFSLLLEIGYLPESLASAYYWDCARLNASWGSNLGASLLLIGIGITLSAIFREVGWKRKVGYAVVMAVFFCFLSLTDCRTSIIAASLLLAGCAALAVAGRGGKRIFLAVFAFAVVGIAAYKLSGLIFQAHTNLLSVKYQQCIAAGQTPTTVAAGNKFSISVQYLTSDERSWSADGSTLNGRTQIWGAAIRALLDNPRILLFGRQDVGATVTYYSFTPDTYPFPVDHTHNSWLEVLFRTGVVGLASALYITWVAVKSGLKIVFSGTDMSKKCIAVLVAALLLCGFMEPFLFNGDTEFHCLNIFFLFAVGYMEKWQNEIRIIQ